MGAVCCCLRDECEDFANPNSSMYRNCICFPTLVQNFLHVKLKREEGRISGSGKQSIVRFHMLADPVHGIPPLHCNKYASLFHRGERHVIPSSDQGAASLSSTASLDDSLSDMYRSPPRPLPYDADPRYFRLQQDGQVSRREKGSSHSYEETEPLQRSFDDPESLSDVNKWSLPTFEEGSKEYNKSSVEFSTAKMTSGDAHSYYYSEDEDVCPTCLEEYTEENPKIITKCSHHFHLSCIYEWMERSDSCPVCGKVMAFDETT